MRAAALLALALASLGAGCAGSKVEAIYELSALPSPAVASGTTKQILVPEPRALDSLASPKIAVKPTALTIAYYPKVQLQDSAPKVLQRVLLDTFQNTGKVKAAGLPGQSLLIDYQIVTDIRAFQVETYGADQAHIEVAAKLLNDANGNVVADRVFTAVVPISGDSAEAAAAGLNAAVQQLALDVVSWTLSSI
jgi:cholesterol transport system auxiliary component